MRSLGAKPFIELNILQRERGEGLETGDLAAQSPAHDARGEGDFARSGEREIVLLQQRNKRLNS